MVRCDFALDKIFLLESVVVSICFNHFKQVLPQLGNTVVCQVF